MNKEKVIDILKGIKDGTACLMPNMPEDGEKAIDIAIKAVEQPEQHWIPVGQDLPKIGEYVLCKTRANHLGKYHVCKFVDKDEWVDRPHFDWGHNGFPHVIAWTHFEPYEEMNI